MLMEGKFKAPPRLGMSFYLKGQLIGLTSHFVQIVGLKTPKVQGILTVLVLFEMKLEASPAYQSLTRALQRGDDSHPLFVYDNSFEPGELPTGSPWLIHYHHNPANPGVSTAYNLAYQFAVANGIPWLLLADQDTTFPEDIFKKYAQAVVSSPDGSLFAPRLLDQQGLVSPFRRGHTSGRRLSTMEPGMHSLKSLGVINSGLMVSTRIFEAAGGYDERLKLDFSDFSFLKRVAFHTDKLVVVDAVCKHELSSTAKYNLQTAVNRFELYRKGSRVMAEGKGGTWFTFRTLLRAMHLSFHYRSLRFIGAFISGRHD
jgi:rhamnosyltransferase